MPIYSKTEKNSPVSCFCFHFRSNYDTFAKAATGGGWICVMRISDKLLERISVDLNLNSAYIKGFDTPVKNCWHFSSDGNAIDFMYKDDEDFRNGMNRIFSILSSFDIVILAFTLMDTHIHFILYGDYQECNGFIHEYIRRTSIYLSRKYHQRHSLSRIPISHQVIDTDYYLKIAICYVLKNAPVAGINYLYFDYPWSSGSLYFRSGTSSWTFPKWKESADTAIGMSVLGKRAEFGTHAIIDDDVRIMDRMVFPGEYVASQIVERLFRTHKSFSYFMGLSKESDIESRGGIIANLSLPMQEMRQHRDEICQELFGHSETRRLNSSERLKLAKVLRHRYNSSVKQVTRLCGLVYDEVKGLL